MGKISFNAEWSLKRIREETNTLEKEIGKLGDLLDETTGKVEKPKPYPLSSYHFSQHYAKSPEAGKADAEKIYQESLPIVEANKTVFENNRKIYQRLVKIVENAGIASTWQKTRPRSKYKYDTITSDWCSALAREIPTSDNWSELNRRHHDWIRACNEWRAKLDSEEEKQREADEAHQREIEKEVVRRAMVKRYGLEPNTDLSDILGHILNQNKYLRLAHYLERNRSDWSDGYYYAEVGLDGFTIENETDKKIYDSISSIIESEDVDGRCFRDCEWNYDKLFSMAEETTCGILDNYNEVKDLL